jgi:hypothetical protein
MISRGAVTPIGIASMAWIMKKAQVATENTSGRHRGSVLVFQDLVIGFIGGPSSCSSE